MQIRPATIADARRIAEIHVAAWRIAYRGQMPDAFLEKLDVEKRAAFWQTQLSSQSYGVSVAETDQQIIGFCDLIPSRDRDADSQTTGEIAAIYVQPEHWRQGVGEELLGYALETARRKQFLAVTLWVLTTNHAARKFYEAMGFSLDGAAKVDQIVEYKHELPEVRYRKPL